MPAPIRYDSKGFEPPALILEVRVAPAQGQPGFGQIEQFLTAKIDTGADISVVPDETIFTIRPLPSRKESFVDRRTGERFWCQKYWLGIGASHPNTHKKMFEVEVEVISYPREDVLLGRNVLEKLRMVADGKNQVFTLSA